MDRMRFTRETWNRRARQKLLSKDSQADYLVLPQLRAPLIKFRDGCGYVPEVKELGLVAWRWKPTRKTKTRDDLMREIRREAWSEGDRRRLIPFRNSFHRCEPCRDTGYQADRMPCSNGCESGFDNPLEPQEHHLVVRFMDCELQVPRDWYSDFMSCLARPTKLEPIDWTKTKRLITKRMAINASARFELPDDTKKDIARLNTQPDLLLARPIEAFRIDLAGWLFLVLDGPHLDALQVGAELAAPMTKRLARKMGPKQKDVANG